MQVISDAPSSNWKIIESVLNNHILSHKGKDWLNELNENGWKSKWPEPRN